MTFKLSDVFRVENGEIVSRFDANSGTRVAMSANELISYLADHPSPELVIAVASAKKLRAQSIPIVPAPALSDAEMKALALVDNDEFDSRGTTEGEL